MPDLHRIVREVSWLDLFPWLLLLRTCRLAAEFRKLLLAAAGIVGTGLGWWAISAALLSEQERLLTSAPIVGAVGVRAPIDGVLDVPWDETERAFVRNWQWATRPIRGLFDRQFTAAKFFTAVLSGLWAIAVWGFFGGAICRLAAVQLALDERLTVASALSFASRKWLAYVAAPLMPLGMVALLTLPLFVAGLVMRVDFGVLITGVLWPLAIISGVLIMLLVAGLALGFPLMWASVATDGSDSFDAVSRSYTYVGQRPLNYLFYFLVSLAIGIVGWMIINTLAAMTIYLTSWGASWGSGEMRWRQIELTPAWQWSRAGYFPFVDDGLSTVPGPLPNAPLDGSGRLGARLIAFWTGGVRLLALGYAYSFFWTAATGVFLLLRRDVDAIELDEVLVEGEDDPAGLPALKPDAAGVPVLDDEPPPPAPPAPA